MYQWVVDNKDSKNIVYSIGLGDITDDNGYDKKYSKDANGNYRCACCGIADKSRIYFQVDHIVPMNNGGKSVADNLQILCRQCNGTKGDQ
jgi:5-methylcytosine-specific restriction endonuclease McrA